MINRRSTIKRVVSTKTIIKHAALCVLVFLLLTTAFIMTDDPFKGKPNFLELETALDDLSLSEEIQVLQSASGYDNLDLGAVTYSWAAMLVKCEGQMKEPDFSVFSNRIYGFVIPASEYFGLPYHHILGEKLKLNENEDNSDCYIILIEQYPDRGY